MTGLPVLPEGCIAVYGANQRLCVNPSSKHLDTVRKFIEMAGKPVALAESAAMSGSMSSAKNSAAGNLPSEQSLVDLLRQSSQISNQDFALHFGTWESIRDVSREICGGASAGDVCSMLDGK